MPLMMGVEIVERIRRTKAIKKSTVRGVAGRNIMTTVVVEWGEIQRSGPRRESYQSGELFLGFVAIRCRCGPLEPSRRICERIGDGY